MDAAGEEVLVRLAALVLGVAALAAGCGTAPASKSGAEEVAESSAADSARIAVSYGARQYFTGEWDFRKNVGEFSLGPSKQTGSVQIVTRDASYTRVAPCRAESKPTGKSWMKWEGDGSKMHEFGGSLFGFLPSDPGKLLPLLKAASSVSALGKGEERGVAVTRHRADLDVERALQTLQKDDQNAVRSMLRQYELGAKGRITVEYAVDLSGRLRQASTTMPWGEKVTVEFFDYGVDVSPKAPPADEVMTTEEASRMFSAGGPEEGVNETEWKSDCIILGFDDGATGYGGLTSTGAKEGK
jgi:hypothetical protein